jgi:hypothetical protein
MGSMGKIKRIVLDVLKPHQPSIIDMSNYLSDMDGVDGVEIALVEMDINVENIKVTITGHDINYEEVEKIINENGGTIHSIDEVSCSKSHVKKMTEAE